MSARARPDEAALAAFLAAVERRLRIVALTRGAALGMAVALAGALLLWWLAPERGTAGLRLGLALAGALAGALVALSVRRRRPSTAHVVERRVPASRNVVLTAAELVVRPGSIPPHIRAVVLAEAGRVLRPLDARTLQPVGRGLALLGASAGCWALGLALMMARPEGLPALVDAADGNAVIQGVEVLVTPPAYLPADTVTLRDPARVEALAGSGLRIRVRATAARVTLETVDGRDTLAAGPDGTFTGRVPAAADGFLSIEARPAGDGAAARRLIGLTVVVDRAPEVRVVTPGRDLRVPDGQRAVEVVVEAADDHALTGLTLGYTKVTGFGEQFTFLDGEVPLEITRSGPRIWRGRARWPLAGLDLERGDMVVYRAQATDARPGAPAAESDSWLIEVVSEDAAVAGGFAAEDDLDRYALSQQMVVVLTERLMAARDTLPAEDLAYEAARLAAAQRTVRAEFVFMLGGELEDEGEVEAGLMELHEEAHARADAAVAEGRLASQGRIDLARAIQAMSHAVTLLMAVELEEALEAERTALIFLQEAFSRRRYIMRALTERERLDSSRRLTGALADAVPPPLPRAEAPVDPELAALRRVLADAAALAGEATPADVQTAALRDAADLAARLLRIDPGAEALRDVAALLLEADAAAGEGSTATARARLEGAVLELSRLIRARLPEAPGAHRPAALQRLDGALADALRGGGPP
ncbi:MAG: hypothetical protein WEA24_04510 [Gemmatimonadota bacterium]